MRILLSVLVGLTICAATAAGIYQYRGVSTSITTMPEIGPNLVPPATPPQMGQTSDAASAQADHHTDAPPAETSGSPAAIDQPTPLSPIPAPQRTVTTESITPPATTGTM